MADHQDLLGAVYMLLEAVEAEMRVSIQLGRPLAEDRATAIVERLTRLRTDIQRVLLGGGDTNG